MLAEFGEFRHALLVVAQQELLGGALGGALCPVLQEHQLVVAHAPAAGEVLPVLDGAVVGVQLEPKLVEQVRVVHQVPDLRGRGAVRVLQTIEEVWRGGEWGVG